MKRAGIGKCTSTLARKADLDNIAGLDLCPPLLG
jgi:hypothetical protein